MHLYIAILLITLSTAHSKDCVTSCPRDKMQCGLQVNSRTYKLFPSKCAMTTYSECYNENYTPTPLDFCLKSEVSARRSESESCPVFCPSYYRPVCAASRGRSYVYRTFNNGCYLDMLNCRGDDESSGYIEVPLEFCPNHMMKNVFKEQVVLSNVHDYMEY